MKGKVLEEIVQRALLRQGYERLTDKDRKFDAKTGKFEGRGAKHELDAFGQYRHSIPFVHPIRLFGEAKCYQSNYSVGIDIIREAIAVRKDIEENYLNEPSVSASDRHVECFAVFSTSGFSSGAIELARAHGIYLVPLGHLQPIVDSILSKYTPQTHDEAEAAVKSYLFSDDSTKVHFAGLTDGYPIALRGALPEKRLAQTDSIRTTVTRLDEPEAATNRFKLQNTDYDPEWNLRTEIPRWLLKNAIDQAKDNYVQLVVPTMLNEIARQIRIEIPMNDFQEVI